MKDLLSLNGKGALITGGGTGIGLAISREFIEAGARVTITGRREDVLREACRTLGANASYRVCDVSQTATLPSLVDGLESERFPLDILVNNAGINLKKAALEVTDEEFGRIIQTNLNGLFALTREVGRRMVARRRGAILNITSMAALYALTKVAAYSASKTAVLGLTRVLAAEFGPSGVRVNAIAPGFIFSDMTAKALDSDPDRKRRVMERTPMGRMGQTEEVAAAALFLCSDAASFITGVNLPVDGGNSIGF
ncbi:MAG: SDR family oxidoreductase [Methylacidiphilales bacterium]|nr:SDR family oxidoreductase [Candidatus Methylacidiphilales bacterium]